MVTSGYSGTPLIQKLGLQEHMRVRLIKPPNNYFELIEKDITTQLCHKNEKADFIHVFAKSQKDFEHDMGELKGLIKPTTAIWISWYKKSAGIPTDLTEDIIRKYALKHDLVDIKVCAVSDIWSGLKLVVPVAKRQKK
jgi:alanyl-tRNA synthetase